MPFKDRFFDVGADFGTVGPDFDQVVRTARYKSALGEVLLLLSGGGDGGGRGGGRCGLDETGGLGCWRPGYGITADHVSWEELSVPGSVVLEFQHGNFSVGGSTGKDCPSFVRGPLDGVYFYIFSVCSLIVEWGGGLPEA